MKAYQQVLRLALFCGWWLWLLPGPVRAQQPESDVERRSRLERRGAGIRVGAWNVDVAADTEVSRSPHIEGYLQRGLDRHLALENSFGIWWVNTVTTQALPGAPEVETRTYVIPLLTSAKFFPVTSIDDRIEPYLIAGIGFALGIEDQSENAIGGGGTSIVTGFGFRGGVGAEFRLSRMFALSASGKYQWMRFGENLATTDTFDGIGLEGGMTYRFQF